MSQRHKLGARHRAQSIKRRIQSEIIEMLALPARQSLPHVRQHSKSFAVTLLAIVLLGALLLATPWTTESGTRSHPIDAVLTSVSATSVTGMVTVDTQTHWNFLGELIILILILVQLGGLGFMVGASIVLQMLRRGQARLSDQLMIAGWRPNAIVARGDRDVPPDRLVHAGGRRRWRARAGDPVQPRHAGA